LGLKKALEGELRVTTLDMYGFGKTPHPEAPLFLCDYAKAIVDIIFKYKMPRVVLVGHSFGGRVAMYLAIHYARMLDKIVLINPSGMRPHRNIKYIVRILTYKTLKKLNYKSNKLGSKDYIATTGVMRKTFVNIVNEHLDRNIKKIITPTLIIHGDKDSDIPYYMIKRINKRIKKSCVKVIHGTGHFCHIESPNEVVAAIKEFIGGEYDDD
jgi:pimeloyl-ACP methyl ester carboxylesterase